jgi:hypothetical protein
MRLSNPKQIGDLTDARNVTDAYRKVGLLPEPEQKRQGIGTAPVNIFEELLRKLDRGLGPVIDITSEVSVDDIPPEMRKQLLEHAQPVVEFVERVKAAEAA